MGFISQHIMPLVIITLGGGLTDTHFVDKINFQKLGMRRPVAGARLVYKFGNHLFIFSIYLWLPAVPMTAQTSCVCGFTAIVSFIMYIKKLHYKTVCRLIICNLHQNNRADLSKLCRITMKRPSAGGPSQMSAAKIDLL